MALLPRLPQEQQRQALLAQTQQSPTVVVRLLPHLTL
jgi:hypothetical protein